MTESKTQFALLRGGELDDFVNIVAKAYPGLEINSDESLDRWRSNLQERQALEHRDVFGVFRQDELVGGMVLYDFQLRMHSRQVLAGGIGMVAVDMLHKKKKVARDLMRFFMDRYLERGASLLLLYPFRPDFYKRMGFGYGPKMNLYRFRPAALPATKITGNLRYIGVNERQGLLECYNQFASARHGMILRDVADMQRIVGDPKRHVVGIVRGQKISAYLVFDFERKATFLDNEIRIVEWLYSTPGDLALTSSFLRSQRDQVEWITYATHDDSFHHLLDDPRNGSGRIIPSVNHESNSQGVGLMYRVLDPTRLFRQMDQHNFGGQSCTVRFVVRDSFVQRVGREFLVEFDRGAPTVVDQGSPDVTVGIDVADFSSMFMGVVPFRKLHLYGRAEISNLDYLETINQLFLTEQEPMCMTYF